jgi:hypothetical protein
MSHNSNTLALNNDQMYIINILNNMYNNNIRQLNNMNATINSLIDSNNQIRNLMTQIIDNTNSTNSTSRRSNSRRTYREDGLGRLYINNRPYIIDDVQEYRLPRNNSTNRNGGGNGNSEEARNNSFSRILQSFFQPVEVYPTPTQIEDATRRTMYSNIVSPRNSECPISLESFNDTDVVIVIRHCGHIFHSEELITWFRSNCRCPVCRYDIRTYNSNASTELFGATGQGGYVNSNAHIITGQNDLSVNQNTNIELERSDRNLNQTLENEGANIFNNIFDGLTTENILNDLQLDNYFNDLSANLTNEISDSNVFINLLNTLQRRPR